MLQRKGIRRSLLLLLVLLPSLYFYFFTSAPKAWQGVDEAVVEKIAHEHGRTAVRPLIDPGEGDLLLFAFLCAGAIGGFAAGYFFRDLVAKK